MFHPGASDRILSQKRCGIPARVEDAVEPHNRSLPVACHDKGLWRPSPPSGQRTGESRVLVTVDDCENSLFILRMGRLDDVFLRAGGEKSFTNNWILKHVEQIGRATP